MLFKKTKIILFILTATLFFNGCGNGNKSNSNGTVAPQFTTKETKILQEGESQILTIQTDTQSVTYSIAGGADETKFEIDKDSGLLSFKTAQDYENPTDADGDKTYEVIIEAKNSSGKTATQTFFVTISNDPSDDGDQIAPVFSSDTTLQTEENEIFSHIVQATDETRSVIYAIDSGADAIRFDINSSSGKLSFKNLIPDFEISSDKNNDKIYEVTVSAKDSAGNKAIQDITVTILNNSTDSTYGAKKVFKTGLNESIYGDVRNFTTNGDGTVSVLERVWEDSNHINNNINYDDAKKYCANLDYAGKTNWRLPTRRELYEIVNYASLPKIDAVFNNKSGGYFWTSGELFPYSGVPGGENNQSWTINFNNAVDFASNKTNIEGYHVRCVSGFTIPNGQFRGTLTITDSTTNLEWENNTTAIDPVISWSDAKLRCENLTLDNKTDWRLPNINELHSIIPNNDNEYSFSPLTAQKTGPYWSSSELDTTTAWYVENYWDEPNLRDVQNDALIAKENNVSVRSRCVRGGN